MLFGMAPEAYWPYLTKEFDKEPPAFVYALAQNYKMTSCVRLDKPRMSNELLLTYIKCYIADGFAAAFGFPVYESITQAEKTGKIPFPSPAEPSVAGHSVLAMGYNDDLRIMNDSSGNETVGAIIVKNSWGIAWGDQGYGYLPYEYILRGLATDWWVALDVDFIDLEQFGLPPTLRDTLREKIPQDDIKTRFEDRLGGYNPSGINKSRNKKSDRDKEPKRTENIK